MEPERDGARRCGRHWAAASFVLGACLPPVAQADVAWEQVRDAIGGRVCVERETPSDRAVVTVGDDEGCAAPRAMEPLADAITEALAGAQPLLTTITGTRSPVPPDLDEYAGRGSPESAQERVRERLLQHEPFLRVVLPRVEKALRARSLACADCPRFEPLDPRVLSWEEFFPYVRAFISVQPVRTVDAEGRRLAEPHYAFRVCGAAGARGSAVSEEDLGRAGLLVARRIRDRIGEDFMEIVGSVAFGALRDDVARAAHLRKELPAVLQRDPEVLRLACETAQEYGEDLGLRLRGCVQTLASSPP